MEFNCKESLSGVATLNFYLLSETDNWPVVVDDTTTDQITFTPEEVSVDATLDDDSIITSINQRISDNGSVWNPNIRFSFITRSEALDQLLDQYQNKPGVVVLNLNTGFKKLIGTNLEPVYLNYDVSEGRSIDDSAGATNLTIAGKIRHRPFYIEC